ncbi:tatD-related DNAse [Cavenderia fasciculata]|uniref:TatD-related DNAse n=1 Tax=Cavenderia fasciculata TaxID=261658 RepID=F4Q4V8_CACFS|nr:tatD-related DNAse [Cavenderia fasciculata]EGG17904.1 tatD-related DNAse [Cavenderia fasciculata]|eukprot:XP_004356388.1 tatD-related DNAse [Cavenderia fasciculata]
MNDNDFPALGAPIKRKPAAVQQQPAYKPAATTSAAAAVVQQQQPAPSKVQYQPSTAPGGVVKPTTTYHIADIGANLADKQFDRDFDQLLQRASGKGVNTIVMTGTSIPSSRKAIELIEAKQEVFKRFGVTVYSTYGVHPHSAERAPANTCQEIREMAKKYPHIVKAVGECGLDFNRNFSSHQSQMDMFERQIEVAVELGLPLFLHERDAHKEFVQVTNKFVSAGKMPKAVVHCFTGIEKEADVYLKMGFYFGFTGVITQDKRGETLRKILSSRKIPLNRIMIETDCPYMTPHNLPAADKLKKGGDRHIRNEPSYLPCVLSTLAQCYGISEEEAANQTLATTKEFFNLN